MAAFEELVARARSERVVVIGGGMGGMVAARECAKVGLQVTLVEASYGLGGAILDIELGGQWVPIGANSWSSRTGAIDELVAELGLSDRVIEPADTSTWLARTDGVIPYPEDHVLGIPANVWDERVRGVIGSRATWRAYLDRVRPPLTIGQQHNLGTLVRTRMGRAVRDQLVAPLTRGRYGVEPEDIDVARAAPGLSAALTRAGSLAGGVGQLLGERGDTSHLRSLSGGLGVLVEAMEKSLRAYGVDIRVRSAASQLTRIAPEGSDASTRWRVDLVTDDGPSFVEADAVIVATGAADVARLLPIEVPELLRREIAQEVVTLVVVGAPDRRGRTTIYSDDPDLPISIVDENARWGLPETGLRAVRLTYGYSENPIPPTYANIDSDEAACIVAHKYSGVFIGETSLRGIRRQKWTQPMPGVTLGRDAAVEVFRRRLRELPGIAVTGAWISGSGLSTVAAHAREQAERVRVKLLWDESGDGVTLDEDHPLDKREETP